MKTCEGAGVLTKEQGEFDSELPSSLSAYFYLKLVSTKGSMPIRPEESYEYELYLTVEDIEHTKTKTRHPQTNGICERFHRTIQEEFYRVAFRKKLYRSVEELQVDVDEWIKEYNEERTHLGKYCFGKTPMQTFVDSKKLAQEKMLDALKEEETKNHFLGKSPHKVTGLLPKKGFEIYDNVRLYNDDYKRSFSLNLKFRRLYG
jgi:hypothetical protein